jgi:uncharacterized OB-fold protein
MSETALPRPQPTALSRPFWEAANENRLVLQKCGGCGQFRWTPQILCPHCLCEDFSWEPVSGKGSVHSFTVVHRPPLPAFAAPYVLAVIELAEGPLMLTRLVDDPGPAVAIGAPAEVAFTRLDAEINLYTFRLTA